MKVDLNISDLLRKASIGLSIEWKKDGTLVLSALEVEFKKKELVLKKIYENIENLDAFISKISKQTPLYLILNGKGILQRISSEKSKDKKEFVNAILPQANADDFYAQIYHLQNDKSSISLIRKKSVDSIIEKLLDHKVNVTSIIIGNEILSNLFDFFPDKPNKIQALGQTLEFEQKALIDVQASESIESRELEVDDFELDIAHQLAFSSAIQQFIPDPALDKIYIDEVNASTIKHKKNKIVKKASLAYAALAFGLLLINTMVFVKLNTKVSELQASLSVNEAFLIEVQDLSNDIQAKKKALTKVNAGNKNISFYSDQIASMLPSGLILNDLTVYPKEKETKKVDFDSFDISRIEIYGLVDENNQLHEFIRTLSNLEWIEKVTLSSLEKENKGNDSSFQLKLHLKL